MFSIKNYFIVYFLGTLVLTSQSTNWEIVEAMGRGVNLGNTLSAPVEGNWAPTVYEQYFIDVSEAGFSNVRIPVDFYGSRTSGNTLEWSSLANTSNQYDGSVSDFIVSPNYLDRVETVIDWSLNHGLYTVLDFHGADLKSEFLETFNSSSSNFTNPTSARRNADLMKFKSIWIQIANRFINHPELLIFEVVNEPYFEVSDVEMDYINLMIIDAIRSTGGNNLTRKIVITGGTSTSYQAPTSISEEVLNHDDNLIASFHYYQPFNFTASSRQEYNNFNWGTNADKLILSSNFDFVKNWSELNNIPVTLGEFGADNQAGYNYYTGTYGLYGGPLNDDRVEYHRYIAEQAINRGFSFSAWCAGNKSTKAIHLRTDNPSTNNSFQGVWVEDVKLALLSDGLWPNCYGPYEETVIRNPDFECGVNSQWNLSVLGSAQASISETSSVIYSGSIAAQIDVTQSQVYNKVILSNVVYNGDLYDKTLIFGCYAKSINDNLSFRLRVKSTVSGNSTYVPSEVFDLTNSYQYYQFEYVVPENTSNVQLQVMTGAFEGTYFFDSFDFQVIDTSLSTIENESLLNYKLYPNPVTSQLNIKSEKLIHQVKIYDFMGKLKMASDKSHDINVSDLTAGFYFIELYFSDGNFSIEKFIKD